MMRDAIQSHADSELPPALTRREFGERMVRNGIGALGLASGLTGALASSTAAAESKSGSVPTALLERSPFVYISPLRANGAESSCHAELWYAWLDARIVVTVAADRWKARSVARGLDRARIWVGDHGRWKTWYGGQSEAFRSAPHFDARAEKVTDAKVLERLLTAYETKYPNEIADWRERMRAGNADGSRIMLSYTAITAINATTPTIPTIPTTPPTPTTPIHA